MGDHKTPAPGEKLAELLHERGWTQTDLARIIGRESKVVNEIIAGTRAITPRTAQELAAALRTPAKLWVDLETAYQLDRAGEADEAIAIRARIFDKAPFSEMIRRNWIEATDDPAKLEESILKFFRLSSINEQPQLWPHAARKTSSYSDVTSAQWAWLYRARHLAEALQADIFSQIKLDAALQELRRFLHVAQELRHIPGVLARAGVRLVVIKPLAGSKIDGACFWLDQKSPVIALSARFDRIDGFWHTLMHEVAHVQNHDGLQGSAVPLDVDLLSDNSRSPDKPASEQVADDFAASFLIDQEQLRDFIVRVSPLYSRQRIMGFANRLKVHPGIVVGQLQYRGELTYSQHRNMLVKVRQIVAGSALTDGWGSTPNLPVTVN